MFRGILKSAKEEKKKMESQGNGAVANSGKSLANRRRANRERKTDLLQDVCMMMTIKFLSL